MKISVLRTVQLRRIIFDISKPMATLNLAAAALQKGRKPEAQRLLEEAKKLDSAGMMTDQIKMMKEQLKMPSMQKHMHNPNMRQRGKFF
jgi:hypothetical protein